MCEAITALPDMVLKFYEPLTLTVNLHKSLLHSSNVKFKHEFIWFCCVFCFVVRGLIL